MRYADEAREEDMPLREAKHTRREAYVRLYYSLFHLHAAIRHRQQHICDELRRLPDA